MGFFTFPIDQAQFSTENEIQVCLKVLDLHSEQCTSYNINFAAENETLSIDRRDVVPVSSKGTLYDKGNALIEQGNYTQAIQSFDKALAIDPNDKCALEGKGYALHNLGNYTEAIQYYDKALAIDPNDKYALNSKGGVLDSLGNHTQAIQYYDKALSIDPNYELAQSNKGFALNSLSNYTQAIQSFDKALAIDPNDSHALNGKQNAISKMVASAPHPDIIMDALMRKSLIPRRGILTNSKTDQVSIVTLTCKHIMKALMHVLGIYQYQ